MPSPQRVCDLHAHVFNARYLPLRGILESNGIPGWIAAPLATLLELVCGRSALDQEVEHPRQPRDTFGGAPGRIAQAVERSLGERLAAHVACSNWSFETDLAGNLEGFDAAARDFLRDPLLRHLIEVANSFGDETEKTDGETLKAAIQTALTEAAAQAFKAGTAPGSIRPGLPFVRRAVIALVDAALGSVDPFLVDDAVDLGHFLLTLIRSEKSLLDQLERGYRREQRVDLFVHHMMDMELAFRSPPYFEFTSEQVPRMRALEEHSGGRLLGFTAFDPRRADWKERLDRDLAAGKCGVKFYPPMGYRAARNEDPVIQDAVDAFFHVCVQLDVPVFAHCKIRGFEAGRGFGINSDPAHWKPALEKHPGLRLCFAHAGGDEQTSTHKKKKERITGYGWEAENDDQWRSEHNYARKVVDLCAAYPNVYCEIAYSPRILSNEGKRKHFARNLTAAFGRKGFPESVMYGSDWHMPLIVNETDRYLDLMFSFFEDDRLAPHRDAFFLKNALRYLNLAAYVARIRALKPPPLSERYLGYLEELAEMA